MDVHVTRKLLCNDFCTDCFWRVDERTEHAPDGGVDVVRRDVLAESHRRARLTHADDGLDVTHGDGHAFTGYGFLTKLSVNSLNFRQIVRVELGSDLSLRVRDVLSQEFLVDGFDAVVQLFLQHVEQRGRVTVKLWVTLHVRLSGESRQLFIHDLIYHVAHDAQDIETRKNRIRQFDVVTKRLGRIVSTADGVRSRDDRTSAACREVTIPALEMEMDCCSIAS